MNPKYNFSILMSDEINLQCTVRNPESLLDVTNGSLVLTKDGTVLPGKMKRINITRYQHQGSLKENYEWLIYSVANSFRLLSCVIDASILFNTTPFLSFKEENLFKI